MNAIALPLLSVFEKKRRWRYRSFSGNTSGTGVRRLILGAWGCGAFGLDPKMMADIFRDALYGPFSGAFEQIVFAITDWSDDEHFIGPFRSAFD